jgi:tripartite-type tricarboxylate transporter receptor subunit TctC
VTLIEHFAAGGNTDGIARMTAQVLSDSFGKSFVVENRPGAGGAIAADAVAKAQPDGHTLLIAALPVMAIVPAINKVRFDPQKDFAPISNIATNPFVIVVNKDVPVKTLAEFVEYVRARKGQLSYGSAGIGSLNHLSMALFLKQAGLDMTHVPYKGNVPAITDLLAGQTSMLFATMPTVLPHAKAGKLRALATIGGSRAAATPELPTVGESLKGFEVNNWIALFAPAGTPPEIVRRWNGEVTRIMQSPEIQARLPNEGAKFTPTTPEQFAAFVKAEIAKWAPVVKASGAKVD